MKRFNTMILLAVLGIVVIGCSTARGPYQPLSREDGQLPHQLSNGVTMLDINVRNAFLLVNHSAAKTPGGQIQARITMQNAFKNYEDLWADVRFVFFNELDQPVETSQWKTVQFPPADIVLVEGNSMRSDVVKYNAQFRNLSSKSGKQLTYPGRLYEHGYWKESVFPN